MPGKPPAVGPTAQAVAANVKRLRGEQNLTYTQLSERTQTLSPVAIRRIEEARPGQPQRQVGVDDLVVLAVALGVSPATLLMVATDEPNESVPATGVGECTARDYWAWLTTARPIGYMPEDARGAMEFRLRSLPKWAFINIDG